MAHSRKYTDIRVFTDEHITRVFTNRLSNSQISTIINLRDEIIKILDCLSVKSDDPQWMLSSINKVIDIYVTLFSNPENISGDEVNRVYNLLMYNQLPNREVGTLQYPIPTLQNFALTAKLDRDKIYNSVDYSEITKVIQSSIEDAKEPISTLINELEVAKTQVNDALSLINKEVGKIGVKKFATIFEDQARAHSYLFEKIEDENGDKSRKWMIGNSQIWILVAILIIIGTGYLATHLDIYFPITGESFTPEVLVHIVGRAVAISVAIFLISFAFRQYRVNMHLHTLNQYRANTLKSFEYFTKAPDVLEPASYNAILMKVAESIYESGQTGYISTSDSHNDIPSLVDITKIVNPVSKL